VGVAGTEGVERAQGDGPRAVDLTRRTADLDAHDPRRARPQRRASQRGVGSRRRDQGAKCRDLLKACAERGLFFFPRLGRGFFLTLPRRGRSFFGLLVAPASRWLLLVPSSWRRVVAGQRREHGAREGDAAMRVARRPARVPMVKRYFSSEAKRRV